MSNAHADWQLLCRQGLEFFGRVTANLSHEMKNCLAIMNEQTYLLKELLEMEAQGRRQEPGRIQDLAGKIIERIQETDRVIKRLNTFAHSADEESRVLEAGQLLELVAQLYRRLAALKGLELELETPPASLTLTANPFFLEAALFACLDAVCQAGEPGRGPIRLWVEEGSDEVRFWVGGARPGELEPGSGPAPGILQVLGARLESREDALGLELPRGS